MDALRFHRIFTGYFQANRKGKAMLVLITGGARSGKSSFAECYAAKLGQQGVYIATAQAYDDEMKERIGLHRKQREEGQLSWSTVEEPLELARLLSVWSQEGASSAALRVEQSPDTPTAGESEEALTAFETEEAVQHRLGQALKGTVVLVDCLTLWLTNWLLRYEQEPDVEALLQRKIHELAEACNRFTARGNHLLLVTNEVGYGLVPEYKLGRQFRDLSGRMNQRLAREAEQVFLVTSGIPLELKSIQYRWDAPDGGAQD